MLLMCKSLEEILKELAKAIVNGQMDNLPGLLSRRMALMKKIQRATPSTDEAEEIGRVLESVIDLEQLVTGLAEKKKMEIMDELKGIRNRKVAHAAYGNQSLKGVRP